MYNCSVGLFIKAYKPQHYNSPYPETESVVERWEPRQAGHEKLLLVI